MSNLGSVKLWEKHGFVEEPELRGEFSVSFDIYSSLPAALPTFIFYFDETPVIFILTELTHSPPTL
jgi:hypothetical protein